jgi:DUF1680 family protein
VRIGIELEASLELSIALRIPHWAIHPSVEVNGVAAGQQVKPGWWGISREWRSGDEIFLRLPMYTRSLKRRYDRTRLIAFVRGPLVLSASGEHHDDALPPVEHPSICPAPLEVSGDVPLSWRLPLKGGTATLEPYYRSGEWDGRITTWFRCR